MKVAVSVMGNGMEQQVSPVFGRCNGFMVAELVGKESKKGNFVPNKSAGAAMGAGIAAAQQIAEVGVQAVIAGNFGPNAFMVLHQAGIKCYQAVEMSVEQALKQLSEGKLQQASQASAPGHFGMGTGRGAGMGSGRGAGRGRGPPM